MNITWFWTMKKPQVPLAQGLHEIGIPLMQEHYNTDIDLPIKHVEGDIYFGKEGIESLRELITKKIRKDPNYPDKIRKMILKTEKELKKVAGELDNIDAFSLSDEELLRNFFMGYNMIGEMTAFMSFKGTVQMGDILGEKFRDLLSSKIQDREKLDNLYLLFSMPVKNSFMAEERNSIAGIAGQDNKESLIVKHCRRFSWMGCVMYLGMPYTPEHYKRELDDLKKSGAQKSTPSKDEREKEIRKLIQEFNFTEDNRELLRQFREWTHLRTYIKDMTSYGMRPTIKFLQEIGKRIGFGYKDLLYLSRSELKYIFDNKELLNLSRSRQDSWGFTLINSAAKYYDQRDVDSIRENEEKVPSAVKGVVACRGNVKGSAVIVKSVEDLDRVNKGDILITHMTTTNFVPVLPKVSAIVTDEGGLTCHAAIVSREMNIPCIIGTRYATKAFKDGDLIEVDAENGVVRKV